MNLSEYLAQFSKRDGTPIWLDLCPKDFRGDSRARHDVLYTNQDWAMSDLVTVTEHDGTRTYLKDRYSNQRPFSSGYHRITRPMHIYYDETD